MDGYFCEWVIRRNKYLFLHMHEERQERNIVKKKWNKVEKIELKWKQNLNNVTEFICEYQFERRFIFIVITSSILFAK